MSATEVTFIGIDLAWQSDKNATAIAIARGGATGAVLVDHSEAILSTPAVAEYVLAHSTGNTVVAVDAPLIIRNATGARPVEKLVTKKFGQYDAGAYPSNLSLYPNAGSVALAERLEREGFEQVGDAGLAKHKHGRWFFEVYPHPAQVRLFNLPRIIKYKARRGRRVALRRGELERLQCYLRDELSAADPPLFTGRSELLRRDISLLRGRSLKWHEDLLDAYFCAYLALSFWSWGAEKNEVFGDLETGYIVVPTSPLFASAAPSQSEGQTVPVAANHTHIAQTGRAAETNHIDAFNSAFEPWGIRLPADAVEQKTAGRISEAGWFIRYLFGNDEQGEYLDYYAAHRMTNDRHVRLRASGKHESLRALCSFRLLSRDPEEDARLEAEYQAENQEIAAIISAKGYR